MTRIFLRLIWDRLRASYWFVPAVVAVLAVLLSQLILWSDAQIPNEALIERRFILTQDPEQALISLLGLAGTVLGTAGVVFSLLTVPMSLAASQFGSRLLRLNLRDKTTQFVLGVFAGTFVYCLATALSIPPASVEPEALQLTMTVALLVCLAAFGSVLALIHHIGTTLQAPNVAASAGAELRTVIRSYAPESSRQSAIERQAEEEAALDLVELEGCPIYSEGVGYIQRVDPGLALPLARARGLVIRLVRKPGDFVRPGDLIALVWPPHAVDQEVMRRIRGCYQLGNGRTPTQDIEYAVNQLVSSIVWDQERVSRRSAELAASLQGLLPAVRSAQAHIAGVGPGHA